jgi:2-keto-3-deoxy-L-rhamnonate aldolase RhmA
MKTEEKEVKKLETDYLGPSDIVNQVGGQYVIKEKEMESALQDVFEEIEENKKKS